MLTVDSLYSGEGCLLSQLPSYDYRKLREGRRSRLAGLGPPQPHSSNYLSQEMNDEPQHHRGTADGRRPGDPLLRHMRHQLKREKRKRDDADYFEGMALPSWASQELKDVRSSHVEDELRACQIKQEMDRQAFDLRKYLGNSYAANPPQFYNSAGALPMGLGYTSNLASSSSYSSPYSSSYSFNSPLSTTSGLNPHPGGMPLRSSSTWPLSGLFAPFALPSSSSAFPLKLVGLFSWMLVLALVVFGFLKLASLLYPSLLKTVARYIPFFHDNNSQSSKRRRRRLKGKFFPKSVPSEYHGKMKALKDRTKCCRVPSKKGLDIDLTKEQSDADLETIRQLKLRQLSLKRQLEANRKNATAATFAPKNASVAADPLLAMKIRDKIADYDKQIKFLLDEQRKASK